MKQIKMKRNKSKSRTKNARTKKIKSRNKTRRVIGGENEPEQESTYDYSKDIILSAKEECFPETKTYTQEDLMMFLDCSLQPDFDVEKCRYLWHYEHS
jgi:hypothetical protein